MPSLEGEKLFAVNQHQQVFSTILEGTSLRKNQLINNSYFPKVIGVVNSRARIKAHIYLTPEPVLNPRGYLHFRKGTCYFLVDFHLLGYLREMFLTWVLCFHCIPLFSPHSGSMQVNRKRYFVNPWVICTPSILIDFQISIHLKSYHYSLQWSLWMI